MKKGVIHKIKKRNKEMESVKTSKSRSNRYPLQNERQRRNSDLPPKKIENPHSKVIRTKKTKGQPADKETLMGVINYFREQYGQNALDIEPELETYVEPALNKEKLQIQITGSLAVQYAVIVDDYNDQTPTAFIKSWIKETNTLYSLLSPANKGYLDFVEQPDGTKKLVFINVLTYN